jgi:P27 family predicted phage terminase small subunit
MPGVKGQRSGGANRKPTVVKLLQGNPGRRPLNKQEPKPKVEIPPCPQHLSKLAKEEWRRMSVQLHAVGMLTAIDRAALAAYCQSWGRWIEAEWHLEAEGLAVTTADDNLKPSPWLSIADKAMHMMHRYLTEFGMTPGSRSRVKAEPPPAPDPFDELLNS